VIGGEVEVSREELKNGESRKVLKKINFCELF
jgi:hypothetical protein